MVLIEAASILGAGTLVTCGARKGLLHGPLVQMDPTGTDCRWLQHVVFNVTSEDLWSAGISHIDTGEQRRELYPLDVPLTSGAKQAPEPSSPKPRLVLSYVGSCTMELEQPSPDSGGSGCRVKLSSYGSRERVELHVELENRSRRALSLALGSFTAGSSSSCILSASLQSCLDGTWKSACVLQPRGYAKQRAAMFLPAFQAVKMRILGKVVSLGRFGGLALRVGGDAPNAAEVLLPLTSTEVEGLEEPNQLKPLLRFTVGKPVKTLQVDPKPVWIGPHEARQPRRYSTFETEVVSEVCELAMCDDSDAKLAPRMQTRRLQAFQRSLSPQLPVPRHHEDIQEDKPSSVPDPMRSTFSGLRSARMKLRSRPNTVPAIVDSEVQAEPPSELADPSGLGNKPPRSQRGSPRSALPSLTVIHHGTAWRNLGRSQDVLADPVLLELAEAASGARNVSIALTGRCFLSRLGQRFADALRSLGYKVILGNALLVSWVSAHEDSNDIAELVLVAHWKSLHSCIGILQSHVLRKAVILCDHCDEASAMAEAKTLPCSWQVVPSLIFN